MQYAPIRIKAGGRTWNGTWHVEEGQVLVSSAHGSAKEKLGRQQAKPLAEKLLAGIFAKRA